MDALLTPLYPGYGTHFSYVWVGTPGQRQSVIIDTGSHYTAFPCTGCSQVAKHARHTVLAYGNLFTSPECPRCFYPLPSHVPSSFTLTNPSPDSYRSHSHLLYAVRAAHGRLLGHEELVHDVHPQVQRATVRHQSVVQRGVVVESHQGACVMLVLLATPLELHLLLPLPEPLRRPFDAPRLSPPLRLSAQAIHP